MPKLLIISGEEAIERFQEIGYEIIRQRGSHVRMYHKINRSKTPLSIPVHKQLGRGLLRKLIRDADITVEEFNKLK